MLWFFPKLTEALSAENAVMSAGDKLLASIKSINFAATVFEDSSVNSKNDRSFVCTPPSFLKYLTISGNVFMFPEKKNRKSSKFV